jgi:hypothetical protein
MMLSINDINPLLMIASFPFHSELPKNRRSTIVSSHSLSSVRCRQIGDADVSSVAKLLRKGFPRRSREYWLQVLDRLAKHPTPPSMPKYGYLLENASEPVGVILLISSTMQDDDTFKIRCNVSSWYVEPNFRIHAPLLISQAIKKKNITYFNISPAKHTLPIVEAQGFSRFSDGQFVTSVFRSVRSRTQAQVVGSDVNPNAPFEPFERDLLLAHAQYGCISVWCTTSEGAYPFVFLPRVVKRIVPCVQLIYCRHIEDFIQFARPIGSYLWSRGRPFVLIDSKGPIRGLVGRYFDGISPKYSKGPVSPRLGDLAYTEVAMLPCLY